MATILADNIISPLGLTTQANCQAIESGMSALRQFKTDTYIRVPFPFTAALFSEDQKRAFAIDGYTSFESLAITSIRKTLATCRIPIDQRTCLLISSTKHEGPLAAQRIAQAVGIITTPIIVCNACISGVSALILADRLIEMQRYDYAIVCGLDLQTTFIMSGFYSLKALSQNECHPFDLERTGLNLGEAAATVILGKKEKKGDWYIWNSAVRNDAYHCSSPSPKGEGCRLAIEAVMTQVEQPALINAHGTATLYNDQMEARAISQTGLSKIPVNALKGYFGHTMGAAGILESIITMHSLDNKIILGTKGFKEIGVSGNINIIRENTPTDKTSFLKIISGFGGCNAAIHIAKTPPPPKSKDNENKDRKILHRIVITPQKVQIDNETIDTAGQEGKDLLIHLYKTRINDYPRFYKMDALARLGFVATELLLQKEKETQGQQEHPQRAVIFCNESSSVNADRTFLATISSPENFFPSPSAFVYTLPNIANAEVAIRNQYHGETAFYILPHQDENIMQMLAEATMQDPFNKDLIAGWLECKDEDHFQATLTLTTTH